MPLSRNCASLIRAAAATCARAGVPIVRPLHLFDICMVNDGAVCLIVRRADMARYQVQHFAGAGQGKQIVKIDVAMRGPCEMLGEALGVVAVALLSRVP